MHVRLATRDSGGTEISPALTAKIESKLGPNDKGIDDEPQRGRLKSK
jgi:hypothetical protein